jgi:hypothetical protein
MAVRKIALTVTTVVAAIAVATAAGGTFTATGKKPTKANPTASQRLEGTWMSTVTLQNPPPGIDASFLALNTFGQGGDVVVSSSQGHPTQRSLAHGEWKRIANRRFASTFTWFRFDAAGQFIGTQRVRRTLTLAPNLTTFTAMDVVEIIAPNGVFVATLNATETAARLGV